MEAGRCVVVNGTASRENDTRDGGWCSVGNLFCPRGHTWLSCSSWLAARGASLLPLLAVNNSYFFFGLCTCVARTHFYLSNVTGAQQDARRGDVAGVHARHGDTCVHWAPTACSEVAPKSTRSTFIYRTNIADVAVRHQRWPRQERPSQPSEPIFPPKRGKKGYNHPQPTEKTDTQ